VVGGGVLASKAAGAAVAVVARKATEMADASAVKRTILRDLIFWGNIDRGSEDSMLVQ
jgi:hypothetical protein